MTFTSTRPYLLRAIYEWLNDNNLTPYILVDAMHENVMVPEKFIEDGEIILNIAPLAVMHLELANEVVTFQARFSGVLEHIYIPVSAVMAIYSHENGRGMVFGHEDQGDDDSPSDDDGGSGGKDGGKKPHLRVVK